MESDNNRENKDLMEYEGMKSSSSSSSSCPLPSPFLLKTCMLVEDPSTDEIISWNEDGSAFVVWQPAEFSRDLLPTVFKHSNFSSFVRQLNTYGFRKVATDRWEFKNDMFRRGQGDQLCEIRRRKAWSSSSSNNNKTNPNSTAQLLQLQLLGQHRKHVGDLYRDEEQQQRTSPAASSPPPVEVAVLLDENKRLREENGFLSSELTDVKKKCKELIDLAAAACNSNGSKSTEIEMEEFEVGDGDGCNNKSIGPMLFGVRLRVKGDIDHDMFQE